jgi:hypothetical protein
MPVIKKKEATYSDCYDSTNSKINGFVKYLHPACGLAEETIKASWGYVLQVQPLH